MAGTLILSTPWSRDAFPAEHRPDIEALIPDGTSLVVGARAKPGEWTLILYAERTVEDVERRRPARVLYRATVYGRDLAFICAETLRRWDRAA